MYDYATVGGAAGNVTVPGGAPAVNGQATVTLPATSSTDWYVVSAFGDVDGNGVCSAVIGTSWTNDLFTYFDGE